MTLAMDLVRDVARFSRALVAARGLTAPIGAKYPQKIGVDEPTTFGSAAGRLPRASGSGMCRPGKRVAAVIGGILFSLAAGAVNIRENVNSRPELCRQFADIIKASGVSNMTDAQLCHFRFDQLPAVAAAGFTFPTWKPLKVSDPLVMYKRMVLANWGADWADSATPQQFFGNYIQGLYQGYEEATLATREHAVSFYTATLPTSKWFGHASQPETLKRVSMNFHLLQMRINFCADKKLRSAPYYAVSYKPDLNNPFDSTALDGSTIALWHGDLLLIDAGPTWWFNQPESPPPSITFTINWAAWYPSGYSKVYQHSFRAGFDPGPTVCSYTIEQ